MCSQTPADVLSRTAIDLIRMNVRSLFNNSTNADIMVASETRLSRYIPDSDFHLDGYNIFRTDRRAKGGGVGEKKNISDNSSYIKFCS